MNFELTAAEAVIVHEALMSYMNNHRASDNWWPTNELRGEAAERLIQRLDGLASGMRAMQVRASEVPTLGAAPEALPAPAPAP